MIYTTKLCTKDNPYTKERDEEYVHWVHDNTREIGYQKDGYPGGDIVTILCDNCESVWEEELPQ